ncbi:hypothetical protein C0584_04665 [Candidatus Parcubacteria bacterium]|nr:MAG: hypothetical protein C0584_04665 [Candidatus Parcubacteria bacterium]
MKDSKTFFVCFIVGVVNTLIFSIFALYFLLLNNWTFSFHFWLSVLGVFVSWVPNYFLIFFRNPD